MRITVEVPDQILKAAEDRNRHIVEFVQELMTRGLESLSPSSTLNDGIARIRALRGSSAPPTE